LSGNDVTYYEKNTGDLRFNAVSVTSSCAGSGSTATPKMKTDNPATLGVNESLYNVGDANNDTWLDPNETDSSSVTVTNDAPNSTP
jgi:hypothetical protein